MQDPSLPIQKSSRLALVAALTSAGYDDASKRVVVIARHDTPTPYIILGQDTNITFSTKSLEGAETTHTFVVWGLDPTEVKTMAALVVSTLTDRDNPLQIENHVLVICSLDFKGEPIESRQADFIEWGIPVRIRLTTQEAAVP